MSEEAPYTEGPYNRALGRLRRGATFAFVGALIWISRPTLLDVIVGSLFVVLGEGVRFWAAGHLFKTKELATYGPYRYTRNPLYLGRLLIFTGIALMSRLPYFANLILLALGWIYFFGVYLRRKERVEPARLERFHGEAYRRYFEAVPALFPSLRPYPEGADSPWAVQRMLRNREQYMVIGLAAICAFQAWRSIH